ncbi:hypothetical protein F4778DRAFT_790016 [Xylariomycetidae sp. FL2044]|nr:hypothetical protein F4778DRAFT_790016 [Xylariomycetidae sp. FL2044]
MVEGYTKISQLMSRQDECAIYRRFRRLNSLNLLYLQAELTHLEEDLDILATRDAGIDSRRFHSKDWWSLSQNDDEEDAEQWEKVQEIRDKLEQYNNTLLKQARIARLGAPSVYDLNFLRDWLKRPMMGNFPLVGADRHSYSEIHSKDLVAIKARPVFDPFSHWFTYRLIPKWHKWVGGRLKKSTDLEVGCGVCEYDDLVLAGTSRVIITVVASMLTLASVVLQCLVHDDTLRLAIVVAASALFALALALMTKARMVEIFAATSACVLPLCYVCPLIWNVRVMSNLQDK